MNNGNRLSFFAGALFGSVICGLSMLVLTSKDADTSTAINNEYPDLNSSELHLDETVKRINITSSNGSQSSSSSQTSQVRSTITKCEEPIDEVKTIAEVSINAEYFLNHINAQKETYIDAIKHKLLETDPENLVKINEVLDDLMQVTPDALNKQETTRVLNSVINSYSSPVIERMRALQHIKNNIEQVSLSQLETLFFNESYNNAELAWEALNIVNSSPLTPEKRQTLINMKSTNNKDDEFSSSLDKMISDYDSGETFDMRLLMQVNTESLQKSMLDN
jgi:hypothetical protein